MKKTKCVLTLLLFLNIHITPSFAAISSTHNFITLADIHFNPFIGCDQFSNPCPILSELSNTDPKSWDLIFQKYIDTIKTNYYQDTDFRLLKSTLTELSTLNQQQKPAFILILGDFLAHNFPEQYQKYSSNKSITDYQTFTKKTLQYLTYKLNQAAPNTTLYPVLGNNDSYSGNYKITPQDFFLKDTASVFSALIKNKSAQQNFNDEFPNAGYYAVTLAKNNQRLIILNSILFSTHYPMSDKKNKAAEEQLTWLQEQLSIAKEKQQHVLIALHIPLGIDTYLSITMRYNFIRYFFHPLFLKEPYNEKLLSLLQHYSTTIVGILPAHIHDDSFQLISNHTHEYFIPNSFTPSISPIYGNNPGLKIFNYNDQTFQLINFDTYFYPLNEKSAMWKKEYNFNAVYQPDCKQCSLVVGMLRLKKDNVLMDAYRQYYAVDRDAQPISKKRWTQDYFCGIYAMNWNAYKTCASD